MGHIAMNKIVRTSLRNLSYPSRKQRSGNIVSVDAGLGQVGEINALADAITEALTMAEYEDDASAISAGLEPGDLYQSGGTVKVVLTPEEPPAEP
tara:strand:- start:2454 stop:2738 length:285 start_codon:yes stop_codon:yes gene_type:complete